jgi:ATP-dependent helicase HepA
MMFVVSSDTSVKGFGIGKLVDPSGRPGLVEYFVSPADDSVQRTVSPQSIQEVELQRQERVFFTKDTVWQVGRFDDYLGATELGLRLPNDQLARVHTRDAYVRSNIPIANPLGLLQTRSTETPFWHEGRAALVRSLAAQRAVYRGLTGLASANVAIYRHQLSIARRVLNDPIPRYLLADEVGLGKTIEAGIIVRQHLLDGPESSRVLVIAPHHLVSQWQGELTRRFHIRDNDPVRVVAHADAGSLTEEEGTTLLIIDEAHEVARHAYDGGNPGAYYRAVSALAQSSTGVLLLSATPVLHNEDAFLAMLHLLDPAAYPLAARDAFHARIVHREAIASAVRDLQDDASGFFIEPALEQLRPLARSNHQLATHIDAVEKLIDSDDAARPVAIATLRTHLQESYRLDRRLLRTRRAQSTVRDDLPRRAHQVWPLQDQLRVDTFSWLDQWRFNCVPSVDSNAAALLFLDFLDAALRHPTQLAKRISVRKAALDGGARPQFDGERALLEQAPRPCTIENDPRVEALASVLRVTGPARKRWVVFVSEPSVADEVVAALARTLRVLRVGSDVDAPATVAKFRVDKTIVAIVCDERSETGLNIQRIGGGVIHFDLPLAANRIEQRIGRLDRIGGDKSVVSLVPMLETGGNHANYELAWARCLIDSARVFSRSVASLQHALDAGRRSLAETIIAGGTEAVDDLSVAWRSEAGPLSLEKELRRIESQDLVDEIETVDSEHDAIFDEIEQYEYATEPSVAESLSREVDQWAIGRLHLERYDSETGNSSVEYEYTRRTLLAANRFTHSFRQSFRALNRHRGRCTGWMHYDRDGAMKHGIPIARAGHPFVNDLQRLMETDERGRAYACWREVPGYDSEYKTSNPADVFFRFDFLVEANLAAITDLIAQRGLAKGALTRRAEEAFAPHFCSVWVDVDGAHVTAPVLLGELERPYDKRTDTNLRDPFWQTVDALGVVADWSRLCATSYAVASTFLSEAAGIAAKIARAHRHLDSGLATTERQLAARIAASDQPAADRATLAMERALYEGLRIATGEPTVRVDSVGAMFLSGRTPFAK